MSKEARKKKVKDWGGKTGEGLVVREHLWENKKP